MNIMTLCKACGRNPLYYHRFPFCPMCGKKMSHFTGMEKKSENYSQLYTYYVCSEHGLQNPVMKDICPKCGAEIEVKESK